MQNEEVRMQNGLGWGYTYGKRGKVQEGRMKKAERRRQNEEGRTKKAERRRQNEEGRMKKAE
jgi:hypothetical protein